MTRYEELLSGPPPAGFVRTEGVDVANIVRTAGFRSKDGGLLVLVSEEVHEDGLTYLHVSFSRRSRLPDYSDLDWVRKGFVGEDRECWQYFPPKAEYVNAHPYTLHLWHCYDRPLWPGRHQ